MGCHCCHCHCTCHHYWYRCPRCGGVMTGNGWHNCTPWRWNSVSGPTNSRELNTVINKLGGAR